MEEDGPAKENENTADTSNNEEPANEMQLATEQADTTNTDTEVQANSTEDAEYNELVWERCKRLFLMNSPDALAEFSQTLSKMLTNIIDKPDDPRFRTVKASNASIKKKILDKSGGSEFLAALGFVATVDQESTNAAGIHIHSLTLNISLTFARWEQTHSLSLSLSLVGSS
jgi:predicted helicase